MSINLSVGDAVLYRPGVEEELNESVRHAATVAYVHADGSLNLGVTDSNGQNYHVQSIILADNPECGQCEVKTVYAMAGARVDAMLDIDSTKDISDAGAEGPGVDEAVLTDASDEDSVIADTDTETGIKLDIVDRDAVESTDEASDAIAGSEESGDDTTAEGGSKQAES